MRARALDAAPCLAHLFRHAVALLDNGAALLGADRGTDGSPPSNLTACDVLAQLLLERLTVGIVLSPEGVALVGALVDFLVPDEVCEGG